MNIAVRAFAMLIATVSYMPAFADSMTVYSLDIGGKDSIYKQLGVNRRSFYLEDGNLSELLRENLIPQREAHQIACKQSGFGIKKALTRTYNQLVAQDDYLNARKETLNKRVLEDLASAEVSVVSDVSKQFAQPECQWSFNSAQYADSQIPTVVTKFKTKAGIAKLTKLNFVTDHQGKLLALGAEQITERLSVERLDTILASIASRYGVEIQPASARSKEEQAQLLKGAQSIRFEKTQHQCHFTARNTYYRSEAAAETFGVTEAHGYIALNCESRQASKHSQPKLSLFITSKVHETIGSLLEKHKAQMINEGQKEKNAGFVF